MKVFQLIPRTLALVALMFLQLVYPSRNQNMRHFNMKVLESANIGDFWLHLTATVELGVGGEFP